VNDLLNRKISKMSENNDFDGDFNKAFQNMIFRIIAAFLIIEIHAQIVSIENDDLLNVHELDSLRLEKRDLMRENADSAFSLKRDDSAYRWSSRNSAKEIPEEPKVDFKRLSSLKAAEAAKEQAAVEAKQAGMKSMGISIAMSVVSLVVAFVLGPIIGFILGALIMGIMALFETPPPSTAEIYNQIWGISNNLKIRKN
jgi:hypothetical protein